MSDERSAALWWACRRGFAEFVAAASPRLLRTAFLLTRDEGHAEDLLQTALARARWAWHRVSGDPEPYVRRIIVNTHATWWWRRWRGEEPTAQLPDRPGGSPQDAVDERERLWQALGLLPRSQRTVMVLRFYEDLTEAQAAEAHGLVRRHGAEPGEPGSRQVAAGRHVRHGGVWR